MSGQPFTEKRCLFCNATFEQRRETQLFCSPKCRDKFNSREQKPDFWSTIFKLCNWRKYNVLALIYTILLQLTVLVFPGTLFLILYIPCKIHEIRTKDYGEAPSEFFLYCLLLPTICFLDSFKPKRKISFLRKDNNHEQVHLQVT